MPKGELKLLYASNASFKADSIAKNIHFTLHPDHLVCLCVCVTLSESELTLTHIKVTKGRKQTDQGGGRPEKHVVFNQKESEITASVP